MRWTLATGTEWNGSHLTVGRQGKTMPTPSDPHSGGYTDPSRGLKLMHTEVSRDPSCVSLVGRDQSYLNLLQTDLFLLLLGTRRRGVSFCVSDRSFSLFCIEFYTVLYRKGTAFRNVQHQSCTLMAGVKGDNSW